MPATMWIAPQATGPAPWAQDQSEGRQHEVGGATYEVEMINALDYVLKTGKSKGGDKLGHI